MFWRTLSPDLGLVETWKCCFKSIHPNWPLTIWVTYTWHLESMMPVSIMKIGKFKFLNVCGATQPNLDPFSYVKWMRHKIVYRNAVTAKSLTFGHFSPPGEVFHRKLWNRLFCTNLKNDVSNRCRIYSKSTGSGFNSVVLDLEAIEARISNLTIFE